MRGKLIDRIAEVEREETDAVHKLGLVRGYAKALRDVLAELEAERPMTDCGGDEVETAARKPNTEKR
jgi:hypothetical protein